MIQLYLQQSIGLKYLPISWCIFVDINIEKYILFQSHEWSGNSYTGIHSNTTAAVAISLLGGQSGTLSTNRKHMDQQKGQFALHLLISVSGKTLNIFPIPADSFKWGSQLVHMLHSPQNETALSMAGRWHPRVPIRHCIQRIQLEKRQAYSRTCLQSSRISVPFDSKNCISKDARRLCDQP